MSNECMKGVGQDSKPCSGGAPQGDCCSAEEAQLGRICVDGQKYVNNQLASRPKKAILSCEGACIKGEVTRVAANVLTYQLQRDNAVRICLGDAATGSSGMLDLIRRAPEVIALEGCFLHCGTEILKRRIPDLKAEIVETGQFYKFDREKYFEIFDLPRSEIDAFGRVVAENVQERFFGEKKAGGCCSSACRGE